MLTIQQAFDLALQHYDVGRLAEAEALFRQILAAQPDHSSSMHYLGIIAHQCGHHDQALSLIAQAISLNPTDSAAHANLAEVYRITGRLNEAIATCRRAIELRPEFPEELKPDYAEAYNNLGNALRDRGDLAAAIAAFQGALRLKPALWEAENSLGCALLDDGDLSGAMAAYRRALDIRPSEPEVHSNLICAMLLQSNESVTVEERRHWNRQFCQPIRPHTFTHADRFPDRRLRIGYISPDFADHVVGRNILPLFKHHHREVYESGCYSRCARTDRLTEEFHRYAALWRNVASLANDALAEMVRQDGIDILVDLTQHATGNRLPVFAHHPAPVQVSFAGYPESAGLDAIEYRISDRWLESSAIDNRQMTIENERVFLIDSFWCYDPCGVAVEVNALPAKSSGLISFGCLNNFCKVNEPSLRLWTRVLTEVQDSRLVILSSFGSHRRRTLDFLEAQGVESQRVEFVEPRPRKEYLEHYRRLDVVLDTLPYNGHTTSLDALWMGVPVVSLAGKRPVSRAGLSQLSNLGLPELVAHSEDEFVAIATRLARDLPCLAEWRRTLRGRMEASVLMDAPRFARNIDAAYRAMWREWCARAPA